MTHTEALNAQHIEKTCGDWLQKWQALGGSIAPHYRDDGSVALVALVEPSAERQAAYDVRERYLLLAYRKNFDPWTMRIYLQAQIDTLVQAKGETRH